MTTSDDDLPEEVRKALADLEMACFNLAGNIGKYRAAAERTIRRSILEAELKGCSYGGRDSILRAQEIEAALKGGE